jgi:predicted mannosyl-3-phosphoglycerate phosphatase (HAD superfamily)
VTELQSLYQRLHGQVAIVGLGDGLNDVPFLQAVDLPVIIHSPWSGELKQRIPHALLTDREGPEGWNQAILTLLAPRPSPKCATTTNEKSHQAQI